MCSLWDHISNWNLSIQPAPAPPPSTPLHVVTRFDSLASCHDVVTLKSHAMNSNSNGTATHANPCGSESCKSSRESLQLCCTDLNQMPAHESGHLHILR